MSFMERVTPVIDETIRALDRTRFVEAPIAGPRYSRQTSIISSAYKRHGRILETAFGEGLRQFAPYLRRRLVLYPQISRKSSCRSR